MNHPHQHKADLLLKQSQRGESGYLTLFLGAAPGVGKTFAMLQRAHELQKQQLDVVIGYVETHGRAETAQLLQHLTLIPRKNVEYQGRQLEEMDLDAILTRQPRVVLVDELAHSNIPSCRHAKRWQDVNELLDAGIDVFTTINIQHLDSLNDVVQQITGVRVKETVPDALFQRLRDIRLIDLPVNELLERLKQGKVYLPEQAQQALNQFFSVSNLTALRELAMQTVASYVDVEVRENFSIQGQATIAFKNHVLVLLQDPQQAEALVRAGCRMAEHRLAQWNVAVFSDDLKYTEIENALNLTRQLGGMTEILYGQQKVQIVLNYMSNHGMSTLVLKQNPAEQPRFKLNLFERQSLTQLLLKQQVDFEISVVPIAQNQTQRFVFKKTALLITRREAQYVLVSTFLSLFIATIADRYLGIDDLSVIFITAVIWVASQTRLRIAVISAFLFFLAYNFFFIAPRYNLQIWAYQGVFTVLGFFCAALISSRLASRLREQVNALKAANQYNWVMQKLGQQLSTALDFKQVQQIAIENFKQHLKVDAIFHLPLDTDQHSALSLSEKEKISADWSFKNQQASGKFTQTLSQNAWWFLPLLASKQCLGVIGLKFPSQRDILGHEEKSLAEAMVEYISQAAYRTELSKALEIANVESESEKLRAALLSSVSHDLRSPLASMIGSAETLQHYRHAMNEPDQESLLDAIQLEGARLDRYIQNLLDMIRLGHDGLSLIRDWIGIHQLVQSAVSRLQRYLPHLKIEMQLLQHDVDIYVHAALIEQAIFNVLENAAKFSPADLPIRIAVQQLNDKQIEIAISDQGQGIPEEEHERIFDMFYTMQRGDRGQHGTGLGLSIVKAIIGAHMGEIRASSAQYKQGTCIRIVLPIEQGS